jgi:SAM-dependent methyltransferase
MEGHEYVTMYQNEDVHWWFQGTRAVILDYCRETLEAETEGSLSILDVGCGTGGTLMALQEFGEVSGIELDENAVKCCHERGLAQVKQGVAESLPYPDGTFDMVFALDVIEHLDDDQIALAEFRRVLKPNGTLLVTVPAFPFLWSQHDVALHHKRRYTSKTLLGALESSGFQVGKWSYYNTVLFPVVASVRLFQRILGGGGEMPESDVQLPSPWVNRLLKGVLSSEKHALRALRLPFGVSLIATCEPGEETS